MKTNALLISIIVLASVLRIVGLSQVPSGFTPDEASFGFDAYSLVKTGLDQWGNSWPIAFKSFGDYKLPLYGYLTIPSVALFGLNEVAVRLPNSIIGVLAVFATYLLAKEITKDKRIALFSAFLLAVSPWHLPLSRGAFEANLTTFFLPMAILFLLKGLKNNGWLVLSSIFLGLNLFTYHSARLLTLPLVLAILLINLKEIKFTKATILSALIGIIFVVSVFVSLITGSGERAVSSGIFNPTGGWGEVADQRFSSVSVGQPDLLARIFNNKPIYFATTFLKNYLSYFSPQFLFTEGPGEATYGMVPGNGVLYFYELLFLAFLPLALWKYQDRRKYYWILAWVLISPIAAALAKGPGMAANRVAFMMPAIQILSATGAVYAIDFLNRKFKGKGVNFVLGGIIGISLIFFLNTYFVKQPALFSKDMLHGAKEVILETQKYDSVAITKKLSEPHIYVAFYTKMDPKVYQEESKKWNFKERNLQWVDQIPEYSLGKYTFTSNVNIDKKSIVTTPEDVPFDTVNTSLVKKIYYPGSLEAYYIYVR